MRIFRKAVNQVGSAAETLGRISREGLGATAERLAELPAVVDRIKASAESFRVLADLGREIETLKDMLLEMRAGIAAFNELAGLKGDVLALIGSLREARGVSDAIAELPAQFRESLVDLTRESLRRQSDELPGDPRAHPEADLTPAVHEREKGLMPVPGITRLANFWGRRSPGSSVR